MARPLKTVQTHTATAVAASATSIGASIPCSGYKTITALARGGTGTIKYRVEISPDNQNWFWHEKGETTSSQFPVTQIGVLAVNFCRMVAVDTSAAPNTVDAWIILG